MDYQDEVLGQLKAQTQFLKLIAEQLLTEGNPSPNYRRHIPEYPTFDWESIKAKPVAWAGKEVIEVEWRGHRFHRKKVEKYNSKAILFSRPAPEWSVEDHKYYVLIRFYEYGEGSSEE